MRLKPCWGALAVALGAAAAACGGGATPIDDDGGPPGDAGPPGGDGAPQMTLTDDLAGGWRFEAGEPPNTIVACGVVIGLGEFEITCPDPSGPISVGDPCLRIRNDLRISGQLTAGDPAALTGGADLIQEYEGEGCAAAGYTTGIPTITKGIAWLWAERTQVGDGGGFWSAVDGTWAFELTEASDPAGFLACVATLSGGAFTVDCPATEQREAVPGCWETTGGSMTGSIGADSMSGELHDVTNREGTACEPAGYPLHEEGPHIPISATRL